MTAQARGGGGGTAPGGVRGVRLQRHHGLPVASRKIGSQSPAPIHFRAGFSATSSFSRDTFPGEIRILSEFSGAAFCGRIDCAKRLLTASTRYQPPRHGSALRRARIWRGCAPYAPQLTVAEAACGRGGGGLLHAPHLRAPSTQLTLTRTIAQACSTCHVYVHPEWFERVGAPAEAE